MKNQIFYGIETEEIDDKINIKRKRTVRKTSLQITPTLIKIDENVRPIIKIDETIRP